MKVSSGKSMAQTPTVKKHVPAAQSGGKMKLSASAPVLSLSKSDRKSFFFTSCMLRNELEPKKAYIKANDSNKKCGQPCTVYDAGYT